MGVVPYVAPLFLAAVVCSFLVLLALPQRDLPGVRGFLVFMVGLVVWSGAYAAELLVPGLGPKILAAKVQYLGIAVIPVAWLTFSAEYADLQLWSRRTTAAAFVLPVATILIALPPASHLGSATSST